MVGRGAGVGVTRRGDFLGDAVGRGVTGGCLATSSGCTGSARRTSGSADDAEGTTGVTDGTTVAAGVGAAGLASFVGGAVLSTGNA